MAETELKSLLMKMKEESEKAVLKLNTAKMKINASGTITSWQIDREIIGGVTAPVPAVAAAVAAAALCRRHRCPHWKEGRRGSTGDLRRLQGFQGQKRSLR